MSEPNDKLEKLEYIRLIVRAFVRQVVDFVFGFKNQRGEIIPGGWLYSVDEFNLDAGEFYDRVSQHIADKKYPDLETSRVTFAQGGPLSKQREYLRVMRERLAIDTCAAPFGRDYFFSCRVVYVPARIRLWHLLALVFFFYVFGKLLLPLLGFEFTVIALVSLLFAVAAVFRNASTSPFSNIDTLLLKIPVVGTIYDDWFRTETYYREDTRELYRQKLPNLIKTAAEEFAGDKGLKAVGPCAAGPAMKEFYGKDK
jgi:hypothetical protein